MFKARNVILSFIFSLSWLVQGLYAQGSYTLHPSQKNEDCTKGAAGLELQGVGANDTLAIAWSNGQTNVTSIDNLDAADYNVHITIRHKLDTTINYTITKEKCKVGFSNHFTPNGDNYNDHWQASNTDHYPNFELYVFNKWGQQVHSQKGHYTPWDGQWNGINALDGTYYYVFYYDGGNKHDLVKGDVTILR